MNFPVKWVVLHLPTKYPSALLYQERVVLRKLTTRCFVPKLALVVNDNAVVVTAELSVQRVLVHSLTREEYFPVLILASLHNISCLVYLPFRSLGFLFGWNECPRHTV